MRIKAGHERCVDCGEDFIGDVPRWQAPVCPRCRAREDAEYAIDFVDFPPPRYSKVAMKERLGISRGNEDV